MFDEDIYLLTVPGWQNSGPEHWQTLWEHNYPLSFRAEQDDWERPERQAWVTGLKRTLDGLEGSVVLAAHSMGTLTVLHWAAQASLTEQMRIRGALLVAPPDLAGSAGAEVPASGFLPLPSHRLPFKTIVAASRNDPYCSFARAQEMAAGWGAELIDMGEAGHINTAAGYGYWPSGQRLLQQLMLG